MLEKQVFKREVYLSSRFLVVNILGAAYASWMLHISDAQSASHWENSNSEQKSARKNRHRWHFPDTPWNKYNDKPQTDHRPSKLLVFSCVHLTI